MRGGEKSGTKIEDGVADRRENGSLTALKAAIIWAWEARALAKWVEPA